MIILLPAEHLTFGLPKLPCASCYVQVLYAICFAQVALRKRQRSVKVALRKCCRSFREVLRIPILQPGLQDCTPRATVVLTSCDFPAGAAYKLRFLSRKAAADQAGMEPATARLRQQARRPRDNFQRPVRKQQIRTAPQRERFDTHDPSQRVARAYSESKKPSVFAHRPRRSPQRVHPGMSKSTKKPESPKRVARTDQKS